MVYSNDIFIPSFIIPIILSIFQINEYIKILFTPSLIYYLTLFMLTINLIFCMFSILFFINKAFKNFLISSSFFFSLFCIFPIKQHVVSVFQPEISNLLSCRVLCLIIKVLLIMRNEYKKSIRRKTSDAEGKPWKICG